MSEDVFNLCLHVSYHLFGFSLVIAFAQSGEPFDVLFVNFFIDLIFEACEIGGAFESEAVKIIEIIPKEMSLSGVFDEGGACSFHLNR